MSFSGLSEDEIRKARKQHEGILALARLHDTHGLPIEAIRIRMNWAMTEENIAVMFRKALELDATRRLLQKQKNF